MEAYLVAKGIKDPRVGDELVYATIDLPDQIAKDVVADNGFYGKRTYKNLEARKILRALSSIWCPVSCRGDYLRIWKKDVQLSSASGPCPDYPVRDLEQNPPISVTIYPHPYISLDKDGEIQVENMYAEEVDHGR